MVKFSGSVLIADDITAAVREVRKNAPKEIRREVGLIARGPISQRLIRELATPPGRPKYPYRWKSAKQRRAFFASNGFGRGIPTQRTGELERGWRVVVGEGATIQVENSVDYTSYVMGDDQQPGHIQTGWGFAPTMINNYVDEYEDAMINGWFRVVDRLERRAT